MLIHFAHGLEYALLFTGVLLSYLFCFAVRKIAPKINLVEKPREDRLGERHVPMEIGRAHV